jgi:SH3-like domain-containing protein
MRRTGRAQIADGPVEPQQAFRSRAMTRDRFLTPHARRRAAAFLAMSWALALPAAATAGSDIAIGAQSGLPLPRFVSLKADRVNVRSGPSKDHEVAWVYTRAGLPVEITAEFENWRRIRDWEGAEGWVYHSLLSGRRTALIAKSKANPGLAPLRASPAADSAAKAELEPGVLGAVKRCSDAWCRLHGEGFDGWVAQERLWGVYPDEKID